MSEQKPDKDPRMWRLIDLEPNHQIDVHCQCGRSVSFPRTFLQHKYRLPSDMLTYDLQYRLRCKHCTSTQGFTITIFDRTGIGMQPYEARSASPSSMGKMVERLHFPSLRLSA